MNFEIREESVKNLSEYALVPIAFEVCRVFDVALCGDGAGGFALSERDLDVPYVKDYDAVEEENPVHWPDRFDMSNWGLFAAWAEGRRVGGAAVAFNSQAVDMLEGRKDLAVLWDIRVSPEVRGQGIGRALFRAVEAWAIARRCHQLKVETQNINVHACRFYASQGCVLTSIQPTAYPELQNEIQLLWYKDLSLRTLAD